MAGQKYFYLFYLLLVLLFYYRLDFYFLSLSELQCFNYIQTFRSYCTKFLLKKDPVLAFFDFYIKLGKCETLKFFVLLPTHLKKQNKKKRGGFCRDAALGTYPR